MLVYIGIITNIMIFKNLNRNTVPQGQKYILRRLTLLFTTLFNFSQSNFLRRLELARRLVPSEIRPCSLIRLPLQTNRRSRGSDPVFLSKSALSIHIHFLIFPPNIVLLISLMLFYTRISFSK